MRKLSKITESVWGSIRKKSLGQEERLENDVNHMSFDDFTAFITDTYSKKGNWFSISDSVSGKDLHIDLDIIDGITLKYNVSEGKLYNILIDVHDKNLKPLNVSKLENDFQIEQLHNSPIYEVRNLDGTISNNTYVKLIEFFMANKDTLLMESVWGSIRKKSLGQETRGEDQWFMDLIKTFCEKHHLKEDDYTINKDMSVDVYQSIQLETEELIDNKIPFKFNKVDGDFRISDTPLVSLENSPEEVTGTYMVTFSDIETLEGGPRIVGKNFNVDWNKMLATLDGSPDKVGGDYKFIASWHVTDISGISKEIGGNVIYGGSGPTKFTDEDFRSYSNIGGQIIRK